MSLLLLLVAAIAAGIGYQRLSQPFRGFEGEQMLEIKRGSSTRQIAKQLADAGVIENEWVFLAARAVQRNAVLQAGEYQFMDAANVWQVMDRLARGDVYTFEFTVPEGSNIWDIARLLESQHIMRERDFLAAASDPALVHDFAPEAESLEGYLFPATYRLSHKTTAQELCHMMVEQFKRQWKAIGGEAPPHQILTLASLVEEETGVPAERRKVAGVFANRLKRGMQLACDPTVMYATHLSGTFHGHIYKADLQRPHRYNTYLNPGLPPGPISSPGRASIEAALNPDPTDAIYFVSNPDGTGHIFSATLAAHTRAVQTYRDARAAAKTAKEQAQAN
ncbi:MAG: endolytic transglycosylase MltG [Acidobacteriota bacterium]